MTTILQYLTEYQLFIQNKKEENNICLSIIYTLVTQTELSLPFFILLPNPVHLMALGLSIDSCQ